ncbi:unnamed protein product [Rhizoctonia solani]|nr:unnamed protein product [Rhizoctonia solani]
MFDYLTLSVVIEDRIFCVHGGLSPTIHSIDQIKVVDRFREIPHEGAMADLVWSDPDSEKEDFAISPRYVDESDGPGSLSTARFSFSDSALDDRLAAIAPVQRRLAGGTTLYTNFTDSCCCTRGAGYTFGSGVVRKFLETNNMHHILRAHQLCMEGFTVLFDNRLSTVWSAPNYCYRCGNSASILEVGPGETMHFNVFEAAPENQTDGPSQQVVGGAAKVSFSSQFLIGLMCS